MAKKAASKEAQKEQPELPSSTAETAAPASDQPQATTPTGPLEIIRLSLMNCGIIQAASILPDGSPVVLAGDNGAGKSTVLNSIESLLYGRRLAEPVSHGQEKATIQMDLGTRGDTQPIYRVEQVMKAGKDGDPAAYNLKIFRPDKSQVPSPREFIETLIGSGAALDPTEIMQPRAGERPETFAKRQAETLMHRLGLTEQAKGLDDTIATKTEERKKAKDKAADLQARLDAIQIPQGTPDEPVDVAELGNRIATYNQLGTERARQQEKLTTAEGTLKRAKEALEAAQAAFKKATDEHAARTATLEAFDEMNPPEGITKSLQDAQEKLQSANTINAAVTKKKERKTLSNELAQAQATESSHTSALEKLRKERLDLVRNAKLPVEGLELTAEALLYNGKPLIQESTGNQIRICSLLAMSEEPQCRVIFLREGSLMNSANRQIIYDVAQERGWSVWEERFSETPIEGALWIEHGEISETRLKSDAE